jgi:hypothetical protein
LFCGSHRTDHRFFEPRVIKLWRRRAKNLDRINRKRRKSPHDFLKRSAPKIALAQPGEEWLEQSRIFSLAAEPLSIRFKLPSTKFGITLKLGH